MTASIAIPTAALVLPLTEDFVAAVTEVVAQRLGERLPPAQPSSPWLSGAAKAAEYIDSGVGRIYDLVSAGQIPVYHDGSRLMFRKDELDAWLTNGGGKRP